MNNVINELNNELNNENINISSPEYFFTNINFNIDISNVLNESFNNSERQIIKTSSEFISNLKKKL